MLPMSQTDPPLILVVDDSPAILQMIGKALYDSGYNVGAAGGAGEALAFIDARQPDLILLDVMMPEYDGIQLCRDLKQRDDTVDVPVIFMTALVDIDDKIRGFDAGAVDYITKPVRNEEMLARVRTHIELCRQKRELKSLVETKDRLFSIISHDLRAPLSGLYSMFNLFEEQVIRSDPSLHDIVMKGRFHIEHILSLTDNLLKWAQSQLGEIVPNPVNLVLADMVNESLAPHRAVAGQKSVTLSCVIDSSLRLYADPDMLKAAVRNIVSNAVKFTRKGGSITISAKRENDWVTLTITDTGIGMTPERLARLFDINRRFRGIGTEGERGSGLGLVLCKDFVEKNGGSIQAVSKEGGGTSFTLRLPAAKL